MGIKLKFLIILIAYLLPLLLNTLSNNIHTNEKYIRTTYNHNVSLIGLLGGLISGIGICCIIKSTKNLDTLGIILNIIFSASIIALLLPVRGFWSEYIDDEKIIFSRLWIIRKKLYFRHIDYCIYKNNRLKFYLINGECLIFSINDTLKNIDKFLWQLRRLNINVLDEDY